MTLLKILSKLFTLKCLFILMVGLMTILVLTAKVFSPTSQQSGDNLKLVREPVPPPMDLPQQTPPALTVETVINNNDELLAEMDPNQVIILVSGGDVIPARSVNSGMIRRSDPIWPYKNIINEMTAADITFINLETPLIDNCPIFDSGFTFCGEVSHIQGLKAMGVDVVGLANNHSINFGAEGLAETQKHLFTENGILVTGVNAPQIMEVRGVKFAFLAFNDIGGSGDLIDAATPDNISRQIVSVRHKVDIVVVMFHWGTEYVNQASLFQRNLAHMAIDAGADLVIGNHPHTVQGVEIYQDKLINYAWGNLIFDQMWSEPTKEGVIAKYYFYHNSLVDVDLAPVYISDFGQPKIITDSAQKSRILETIKTNSY